MKAFKVAVAQTDIKLGDKEQNIKKITGIASVASKQEADFLCLPEYFSTGNATKQYAKLAETIPGYTSDKLGTIAKENSIHVIASILEGENDKFYNTSVLIDSNGKLLTKYRKIHLFMEERDYITHGKEYCVADTRFGKIGVMICYDAIFPEIARELSLRGAGIIFMPANWPSPFLLQWRLATSARALDNQIWLVATNRIGKDSKFNYFGRSCMVNPYGDRVVECKEEEELIVENIDMKASEDFRKTVDFLKDRQPEVYENESKSNLKEVENDRKARCNT